MLKYIVFILIVICLQSAIGDELVPESVDESPASRIAVPVEIDDSGEIDPIDSRGVTTTDLQTIINCGTALSEPLKVDKITADLATLKYKVKDAVITNMSKCEVKDLKVDLQSLDLDIYLYCPYLVATGQVDINGMIIVLPISGNTEYRIDAEKNHLILNTKLKKFTRRGKTYIKIHNYTIKLETGGPVVYKFKNLFYGNEALSTAAHEYINANWKPVTEIVQGPFYYGAMKYVFKNINKCMEGWTYT